MEIPGNQTFGSIIHKRKAMETAQMPHNSIIDQKMWYMWTMEYYSAIKNNEIMLFIGKWMELENIMLSEVTPCSERQKSGVFFHMWKVDWKDKGIHKYRSDHIYIYIQNIFVIGGLTKGTRGEEAEEQRMIGSQQYQSALHLCRKMV
jgi:hypothetical protein